MRLKSLRLAGFKSFANPTTFRFHKNITAIVGPNGCGKSNVIDAIRWVLGETSAKQLRGGAMSDVIFAGTQEKSAKSLASVELTFEHTQDEQMGIRHELNLYHELAIRRQVNKDGKSDYFVNGTRCRRRDVIDIFLGTGLGARSYAVIEQGMIGRIVDSSPMQLREFIEEGAGVSRYQARRIETQKKLTQANDNLNRLNDLKSELEKQQSTLSRQAQSAKKYQELSTQLCKLEQDMAIHQLYTHKLDEQLKQQAHHTLNQTLISTQAEVTKQTTSLEKLSSRIAEQQWLKDEARDRYHQQQLKLQRAEHALNQHHNQYQQQLDKHTQIQEQQEENTAQLAVLNDKYQLQQTQLNELIPQQDSLNKHKVELQQKLAPLQQQWQAIHQQREQLQQQQQQLEKQQALIEQSNRHLHNEQDRWTRTHAQWQQAWEKLSTGDDVQALQTQLTRSKNRLTGLLAQREDSSNNLEDEQQRFGTLKEQVNQTQSTLQTLEKQHATLISEYNTLHALLYPKPTSQVNKPSALNNQAELNNKAIADKHASTQPTLPLLSDNIELTTQGKAHADSLDKWLAIWLDASVQNSQDSHAKLNWQDWLILLSQTQPAHSAILMQADSVTATHHTLPEELNKHLLPINTLVKAPQLNLWQSAYLLTLDNEEQPYQQHHPLLQRLQQWLKQEANHTNSPAIILTTTGWLIGQFGMIHLEKFTQNNHNNHFLAQREQQRQRLEELEEALNELEEQIDNSQTTLKRQQLAHDESNIVVQELTAQATQLQQQIHHHQQQITTLSVQCERQNADKTRLEQDKQQLEQDKNRFINQQQQLTQQSEELQQQLAQVSQQLLDVDQERNQIRQQRHDGEQKQQELEQTLQQINLQHSQLTISLQHIEEQRLRLNKQLSRHYQQQQVHQKKITELDNALPTLEQQVREQQQACHHDQVTLEEYQGQLSELQTQHKQQQAQLHQQQILLATQQQEMANLTTQLAIAKEHLNDACQRIDSLTHNEKYPLTASSSALLATFILSNFDKNKEAHKFQQQQQEYQQLQLTIGRMGSVNLVAVDELEQINQRLEPLTAQTEDILASINTLTDAIRDIDNKTKTLFLQMLEAVNKDLSHLFAKVFGGGQASLSLIDDDSLAKKDKWRAGLELMAQPKGKKNARLAVLSGGEKTLTALSLIFAIFKQHPAPFCLLDEVDAPLDDANVTRFTGLIQELANDLQFIFISHNKLSMQIADELKGITMPTAGISSLVSVNIDEVEQYFD